MKTTSLKNEEAGEAHKVIIRNVTPVGYKGCFSVADGNGLTAFARILISNALTIEDCQSKCKEHKYAYAGLQQGTICACGYPQDYTKTISKKESTCNIACSGNKVEICGGYDTMSVYAVNADAMTDNNPTQSFSMPSYMLWMGFAIFLILMSYCGRMIRRRCGGRAVRVTQLQPLRANGPPRQYQATNQSVSPGYQGLNSPGYQSAYPASPSSAAALIFPSGAPSYTPTALPLSRNVTCNGYPYRQPHAGVFDEMPSVHPMAPSEVLPAYSVTEDPKVWTST
jgi:WSC domain